MLHNIELLTLPETLEEKKLPLYAQNYFADYQGQEELKKKLGENTKAAKLRGRSSGPSFIIRASKVGRHDLRSNYGRTEKWGPG